MGVYIKSREADGVSQARTGLVGGPGEAGQRGVTRIVKLQAAKD
jgi:hypothetical protein